MSDENLTEDKPIDGAFPQKRQDEMDKRAQAFAVIAHAARSGDVRLLQAAHRDARFDTVIDRFVRQDAGADTLYLGQQLELIRKGLYEIKYAAMKSQKAVSYNTSVPRGVRNYTVRSIDVAGEPAIERDDNDVIPTVEMKTAAGTMSFFNMNLSYSFTDQDIAEAMYAGFPLPTQKAAATRTAFARKADVIAFYGETTSGVKGLLNQAGTTTYTVPATGAGASKAWKDKDSDAILLDLNGAGDAIITATLEVEEPDTWLIPLDAYRTIATKRVGDGTSETVLKYFLMNRDITPTIISSTKAEGANNSNWSGSGSESRMMVYKNDAEHLEFFLPVPFFQGPPERKNTRVTTNCMMRCGGVAAYLPKSVCYSDGVS